MELDSHEAVRRAVLLGRGLALVPQQAVPEDLESGRLVRIEIEGLPPILRRTCLVLRRGDNLDVPAIRTSSGWRCPLASGVWKRDANSVISREIAALAETGA
jgi:DNA-binding transcriptional LysR family regulator